MPEEGYTPEQARMEAVRCLMCDDAPCACDCPAGVDARAFIRKIRFDNMAGAVRLLKTANVLAASCARICPTGTLCAKSCTAAGLATPIDIGGLQRFVCDWEQQHGMIEPRRPARDGKPVGVVGSGPAGLGCAAELAVRGHKVTVFERRDMLGGMLRRCIPSFRLPDDVLDFEIAFLKKLGIEFVTNHEVADPRELLKKDFKAVFLAAGLHRARGGDLEGMNLTGAHQAIDYLQHVKDGNAPELGKRVVVIGGGDTALDAARTARHAGSECFLLYRKTQDEMPAYPNEVDDAWNEGVEFYFRTIVRAAVGKEKVEGVRCVRVKWHPKVRGMKRVYDVEAQEFVIACDAVLVAVGQGAESTFGLRQAPNGLLAVTTENMMTSEPGIFAGGDLVFGGGTAARAVGQGKQAAGHIDAYLKREER